MLQIKVYWPPEIYDSTDWVLLIDTHRQSIRPTKTKSIQKAHRGLQWPSYTTKLGKHGLRVNWATEGLRSLQVPCQIPQLSLRIPDGRESGEAGAADRGEIPPLMSSSGQQKAEEGGALVLLRKAWIQPNVCYKKKAHCPRGGSAFSIRPIRDNPVDLDTDTWLN